MSRSDILRSRIEQCSRLAQALPAGTVKAELEKIAGEYKLELARIQTAKTADVNLTASASSAC